MTDVPREFDLASLDPQTARLSWLGTDRFGARHRHVVSISKRTGRTAGERAFADWSAPADPKAHILVAPDPVAFWHLLKAVGSGSIFPFILVAPTCSAQLPTEWTDPRSWQFETVTILSDSALSTHPLLSKLAQLRDVDTRVATPPAGLSWWKWAEGHDVDYDALSTIWNAAKPIADYREVTIAMGVDEGNPAGASKSLDACGRLVRAALVTSSEPAAAAKRMLIRSDGTAAELSLRRGIRAVHLAEGANLAWSSGSVREFLVAGETRQSEAGTGVKALVESVLGGDAQQACAIAAYVALTHVYPAFSELPVLVVREGSFKMRLSFRRLLAGLCHAPVTVARNRAAQLARIADANGGVMLLEEPGPMIGPTGHTELGRFLECGTVKSASAYNSMTRQNGLKPLDVFGPKIVLAAAATTAGLSFSPIVVDLSPGADGSPPCIDGSTEAVRDDLYTWSMRAIDGLVAAGSATCRAEDVLPMVMEALFGPELPGAVARPVEDAVQECAPPADQMAQILAVCGGSGYVAMAQVMLEIAARGTSADALTPVRVGRWLALQPGIESAEATRRRLFGQISRIYPFEGARTRSDDPTDAFIFCTARACDDCPYIAVCDDTLPGMKQRKNRR